MKKIAVLIAAAALFAFTNSAMADTKIGIIDLSKILAESSQVNDAKAQLKKQFDGRGQEIATAQKALKTDIEAYNKNSPTMKADASKAAQQKIMDEQKKLQEMEASFQNDVTAAQNKAMEKIMNDIQDVVKKVATEEKFDLVLTKMSAAYNNPSLEITDKVIKAMKK